MYSSMQKLRRRIRTFGVDFRKHLEVTHCNIPIIVTKCINELDERGLQIISAYNIGNVIHTFIGLNAKGIYRLSGAKSKMEKLCRVRFIIVHIYHVHSPYILRYVFFYIIFVLLFSCLKLAVTEWIYLINHLIKLLPVSSCTFASYQSPC